MNSGWQKRVCRPIEHRDAHSAVIESELIAWFREAIFFPLVLVLEEQKPAVRENAGQLALAKALRDGTVSYHDGKFSGTFDLAVSRELRDLGAWYHRPSNHFILSVEKIPYTLRALIAEADSRSKATHDAVLAALLAVKINLESSPQTVEVRQPAETILDDLGAQFNSTVPGVETVFTDADRRKLADRLTENLNLAIKDFVQERIPELRRRVELNLAAGGDLSKLTGIIEQEFGVAKNKAKFLAEQETALLISNYRRIRYEAAGSQSYVWETKRDEKVRPGHASLHGRAFSWSNPPIVDPAMGRRCHPGEDFNCLPGDEIVRVVGGVVKAFRRWYSGKLTTVVLASGKTLRATPNHPVLTTRGWKAVGLLDQTDHLVELREELLVALKAEGQERVASFAEIFETLQKAGLSETFAGQREQFHGDGSDREVDVVRAARSLRVDWKTRLEESCRELCFAAAFAFGSCKRNFLQHIGSFGLGYSFSPVVTGGGKSLPFRERHSGHAKPVSFTSRPNGDTRLQQTPADNASVKTCSLRDGKLAFSGDVRLDERFWVNLQAAMPVRSVGVKLVRTDIFEGHVYNLETDLGYYATANVVVSNCRCAPLPIIVVPTEA